jgi:hypothetical protein
MVKIMKGLIAIFVLFVMFFGCVGEQDQPANVTTGNISGPMQNVSGPSIPSLGCTPSYTITEPKDATLSDSGTLSVKAECAKDKVVEVILDGSMVAKANVPTDSSVLNFNLVASSEGTKSILVKSDNKTIHSTSWTIKSIGFTDTSGNDNELIAINYKKAIAFNISNDIEVNSVGAYLRRLQSFTMGSNMILELRSDSSGEPGSLVTSASVPISKATLTPNWIDFPINAPLTKGRYWLVFSVDKDNDNVNIHYIAVDKKAPGNADHLKMDLIKNRDTQLWEETKWERLSFDKKFAFVVSSEPPQ